MGVQLSPHVSLEHPCLTLAYVVLSLAEHHAGQLQEARVDLEQVSVCWDGGDALAQRGYDRGRRSVWFSERAPVYARHGWCGGGEGGAGVIHHDEEVVGGQGDLLLHEGRRRRLADG